MENKEIDTNNGIDNDMNQRLESFLILILGMFMWMALFYHLDGGLKASDTCQQYGDHDQRCLDALRDAK